MNIKPILLAAMVLLPLSASANDLVRLEAQTSALRALASDCKIQVLVNGPDWRKPCMATHQLYTDIQPALHELGEENYTRLMNRNLTNTFSDFEEANTLLEYR